MNDWERIVREHAPMIVRTAFRILGRAADAEDVAQEVFTEAFRVHRRSPIENWPAFLRRLTTFRALDVVRSRPPIVSLDVREAIGGEDPSAQVIAAELTSALRLALGRLPERQAAVFSLHCFEDLTRDEIAQELGISPEAVSTALFKARKRLEELLSVERGRR